MNLMNILESTQNNISVLLKNEKLTKFFDELHECGSTLILGGAVRDWFVGKPPRDIDIVVNCIPSKLDFILKYKGKKNVFGGFKVKIEGVEFDIWSLESTWALKNDNNFLKRLPTLPKTVFLNIDAVGYCSDINLIYENGFLQAMTDKKLDIVYEPNPYPFFCVSKALCSLIKYDLETTDNLKNYIANQKDRGYTKKSFDKYNELNGLNYDYEEAIKRL